MVRGDLPPGCEVMLQPDASGQQLELVVDAGAFSPDTGLAMAALLSRVKDGPSTKPQRLTVPPRLEVRATTAPAPS